MSDLHRRLLHDLPERHAPRGNAFATEPRAVRAWVAALPLANFAATARLLVDALRSMNGQRVGASERLDALEILRAPVNQLAGLVDKQIVGTSFPLPPQRAELGILAQEFQSELATGYRMALYDFCAPNGTVPLLKGKAVALCAARALHHAGARLHKAYLLYRTPPVGAWKALHDVYRFAASLGLDDRTIDDQANGPASAREIYTHAMLLALANPYRFTQRELLELIALTRAFAPHAVIRKGGNDAVGQHPVDCEADRGPGYLPEERTAASDGVLTIDLGALLRIIDEQLAHLPPSVRVVSFRVRGGSAVQGDADLVRRLVDGWTSDGQREHARLPGGYALQSVLGLQDLHFVLAGNEDFDSFMRQVRGTAISVSDRDGTATWAASAEQTRAQRMQAKVIDQGLGGYRLLWERGGPGETVRAKVGELVGLAVADAQGVIADWMVGVIRWMRIDDESRVDAGIGLLARRSLPVGACAVDDGGNLRGGESRGLLLVPMRADEDGPYTSLLVPGLFEREPASIELTLPADPNRWLSSACVVEAEEVSLQESAGAYLQFALSGIDLADESPASDDGESLHVRAAAF